MAPPEHRHPAALEKDSGELLELRRDTRAALLCGAIAKARRRRALPAPRARGLCGVEDMDKSVLERCALARRTRTLHALGAAVCV